MDLKKLIFKLIYPPMWVMLVLAVVSGAGLTVVFLNGWGEHPVSSVVYVPAAYSVAVITLACIKVIPGHYRNARQKVYDDPLGNRFMTDAAFKTHVSLYCSLTINMLYVAVNLISGMLYRSVWFVVLAGYYSILAVMRFLLVRYVKRNAIGQKRVSELRRSRLCAIILLFVNLSLSGAVLMMMYQNKGYEYHGILIYVMAMYTFYITVMSVRNLIKYRKYQSPVMSTAKVINLAAALVSMLSLETAMLTQFGQENSEMFRRIMIAATGAGISVIVVTMSVYLTVRTTKEIKKLSIRNGNNNG